MPTNLKLAGCWKPCRNLSIANELNGLEQGGASPKQRIFGHRPWADGYELRRTFHALRLMRSSGRGGAPQGRGTAPMRRPGCRSYRLPQQSAREFAAPLALPTGGACAGFLNTIAAPAVGLSPAWSLAAHSPAGTVTWMNANAGAAIMTTINAETNTAATTLFTLLNGTSFRRFPTMVCTVANRSWIISTSSCATSENTPSTHFGE